MADDIAQLRFVKAPALQSHLSQNVIVVRESRMTIQLTERLGTAPSLTALMPDFAILNACYVFKNYDFTYISHGVTDRFNKGQQPLHGEPEYAFLSTCDRGVRCPV